LENWEPYTPEEKIALEIVRELQNNPQSENVSDQNSEPFEAYFIGGYPRDLAMNYMYKDQYPNFEFSPHDIDIVTNLNNSEILEKLESKDSSFALEKEAEPVTLEPSFVAESTPDFPEEPPKAIPLIDQCEFSLEAEALERLKACVQACFKTDRGIILLENELLLYEDVEESYRDTWFTETCEAWKDRLHSSLSEEFCSALGLWMVSKQSN
jgi:hypothetical protein